MKNHLINFKDIKFYDYKFEDIIKVLEKSGGVLVAPAASALVNIHSDPEYYKALKKSDVAILDSGFFCILWRIFKNQRLRKFSGYLFLKKLILFISGKDIKVLTIDPTSEDAKINKKFLLEKGLKKIVSYVAPIYKKNCIIDNKLLKIIKTEKPKYIIINLGGQTQEVLGVYIKENINLKLNIICTGAAIAFMTKRQAPINDFIDRYYIGWLVRLLYGPKNVVTRILKSFLLVRFFI